MKDACALRRILEGCVGGSDGRNIDGVALHAAVLLSRKQVKLADVFAASAALAAPALALLAERCDGRARRTLRSVLAHNRALSAGLAHALRRELAFQDAVINLVGNRTLTALKDVLHEIISRAISDIDDSAGESVPDAGMHEQIVELLENGRGHEAAALARQQVDGLTALIRDIHVDDGLDYSIFNSARV